MQQNLKVGDLFRWKDFPYQHDRIVKTRYFIYFGKTAYGVSPVMLHIFTTTSQLNYYSEVGERRDNIYYRFSKGEYGLPSDCVLDLDMGVESTSESNLKWDDIEVLDNLPGNVLKEIFEKIKKTDYVSGKVAKDILFSLRIAGITGLSL